MTRSVSIRVALAGGIACAALAGPASAEEGVAFKNLMGSIGILPRDKDPIAYRERAPLVLPPKSSLPAPTASAAASNPNWPVDPDVAARRRREAEQRSPVTWSETRRAQEDGGSNRLTPAELQAGRTNNYARHTPQASYGDARGAGAAPISPDELRAGKLSETDEPKPGVEPSRSTLAEPPTGYRKATGYAKTQSGPKIDQQERDASPMNWLTRKFSGANDDDE